MSLRPVICCLLVSGIGHASYSFWTDTVSGLLTL